MLLLIENVYHVWPFFKFEVNIHDVRLSVDHLLNLTILSA